jgi:ribonuclease R
MRIEPASVLRALDRRHRPLLTPQALLRELGGGGRERRALASVLGRLVEEGRVERVRGRYRIARDDVLVEGVFERFAGGEGMVFDDDGAALRVEAPAGLVPGDRVLVEPLPGAGERGEVVRAIGGPRREWIGVLAAEGRGGVLRPFRDDGFWELAVPRSAFGGARPGDVVVARLASPTRRGEAARARSTPRRQRGRKAEPARARVVEVLGPPGSPEADFRTISWRHRLPIAFPPEALALADAIPAALEPTEVARRLDLRERPLVTIDPANARDHDDAVFVERASTGGWRLWVAIADVSHYVGEGSALDAEARRRGNSVYFPDRAIPMLPERLSGELCSLRPEVDRLALAAELEVSSDGAVRAVRFHEAVMRSRARLVYEEAAEAMAGGAPQIRDGEVRANLERLAALAGALMRRRFAAGAIDFDLPTAEIVLGDAGHPTDIVEAPRTVAHRAIEEAMLAANRAVAERLVAAQAPALFRVHEPPLPTQLEALRDLLESFDLLGPADGDLGPLEIARAIQRAAGRPEERLVNLVALRSLRQARYDARNRGHFALAFDAYLHFTSPIRRYADLVVHRALRDLLAGDAGARERAAARAARLEGWAARVSFCERVAMEAEREAIELKKCVFLRERVGQRFGGTVTRVAKHGAYVTLDPFFVEGLLHVRRLAGHWELDERSFSLVARGGRERLRLGDHVEIRIASVDVVRGWIDFDLVGRSERTR